MMGDSKGMELTAYELARLRLEDGQGQRDDQALLSEDEQAADRLLREHLVWAFHAIDAPPLADAVMKRVGTFPLPVGGSIEDESENPNLSSSVMGELGLGDGVGDLVREAVVDEAGPAPALWNDLCSSVGGTSLGGSSGLLRQAIQQESDPGFGSAQVFQARRPWWAIGVAAGAVLAAAAALLLYMGFSVDSGPAVEASMGPEAMEVGE